MSRGKWNAREHLSAERAKTLHDPSCAWPRGEPCWKFSTDGTRLGAEIAHQMGTADEDAIAARGISDLKNEGHLTGMGEEQADWEAGE